MTALTHRIERAHTLDRIAKPLTTAVGRLVRPRAVRNLLSGSWLGHPLHPLLSDLPIGAWTMAAVLDTVDTPAADVLVGTGIATAVPTAAAGLNDWSDTYGEQTRVGLVHATANTTALGLHLASLVARRRGDRGLGKALSLTGCAALLLGGYLGGHLTFVKAVNVNHAAWPAGPGTWTTVLAETDLAANVPHRVEAAGAPLLLYRDGDTISAIAATCTHAGGPLAEGTTVDGCVTCPWHGSTFRLADGHIVRGPASTPQPRFETRIRDGHVQVRAQS